MAQPMGLTASDIVFSEATPEQRQLAWELRGEAWAAPMSLEQYVERERQLAQHDLARDGGCRQWVLYLKGYPRQIIASCDSTRKPVLVSEGRGEPARRAHGYAVNNVYTNPSYRRQGMAAFLLRRVQEQIDADSEFSVLYSDSGRNYYAALGWTPFASRQATLTLLPPPRSPSPPSPPSPARFRPIPFTPVSAPQTRPLQTSELDRLCERDGLWLAQAFDSLPAEGKTRVAFLPTSSQISWHLARAEYTANKILPGVADDADGSNDNDPLTPPTTTSATALTKGAVSLTGSAWIYWSHDWREKLLRVLRIVRGVSDSGEEEERGEDDGERARQQQQQQHHHHHQRERQEQQRDRQDDQVRDIAALLEAAVAEAAQWGLRKVVVWNPDEEVRLGCKSVGNAHPDRVKVVFEERVEGGIPSLRWKGGARVEGVVWEENYGYCWC